MRVFCPVNKKARPNWASFLHNCRESSSSWRSFYWHVKENASSRTRFLWNLKKMVLVRRVFLTYQPERSFTLSFQNWTIFLNLKKKEHIYTNYPEMAFKHSSQKRLRIMVSSLYYNFNPPSKHCVSMQQRRFPHLPNFHLALLYLQAMFFYGIFIFLIFSICHGEEPFLHAYSVL